MNEAIWLLVGIVVPRYARAVRAGHRRKIPQHVLRAYHQSDAWRARKRAYARTHPKVCYACLWLMPVALVGWVLRVYVAIVRTVLCFVLRWVPFAGKVVRRALSGRLVRRVFKREVQLHHVTYKGIWDGLLSYPGAEKNRHLGYLCVRLPVVSRVCGGCSHHAAADRVRRLSERFGLPPVAMFRLWVLKAWIVQIMLLRLARTAIVLLWLR